VAAVVERSLRLTARQWATVDATMDNAASNAGTAGQDRPAQAIRQAGWDQVPWVGPAKEWPADGEILTIRLRRDQWKYVLSRLESETHVYEELRDEMSLHLGRNAERAIRTQLG
jgi:hypothetical protein